MEEKNQDQWLNSYPLFKDIDTIKIPSYMCLSLLKIPSDL